MKRNLPGRHLTVTALLVTASLALAACSASKPATVTNPAAPAPDASGAGAYSNGDIANTRDAAGSTISSANVSKLEQAWTFNITGPRAASVSGAGSLAATPIVVNGVVYQPRSTASVWAVSSVPR